MSYEHILLVTDLMSDADVVAQKAKRIVENRPNAAKKHAPNWLSFWSVMTCTRSTLK